VVAIAASWCSVAPVWAQRDPQAVSLATSDGQEITGFWLSGEPGAPAVLLVHEPGRDHRAFSGLLELLRRDGFHVLSLDLRGHGDSKETTPEAYDLLVRREASVYRAMAHDVEAGVRYLTTVQKLPEPRIAIIGATFGCSLGFEIMARRPKLRGMVALSPAMFSNGVMVKDAVAKYGRRPLLILTTKGLLTTGPQEIRDMLLKTADVQLEVFGGGEVRGTDLLNQGVPERFVMPWLHKVFAP
jgi:pimeloyl-ACP methyl ester carboxylesterase